MMTEKKTSIQIIRIIPFWIGMLLTKWLEDELIEVENDLIKINYEKAIIASYNLGD
jgi:hypothetical protein